MRWEVYRLVEQVWGFKVVCLYWQSVTYSSVGIHSIHSMFYRYRYTLHVGFDRYTFEVEVRDLRDWTANRRISTSACDKREIRNKYTKGESFSAFMLPSFCPISGAFCLVGYVFFLFFLWFSVQ